MDVNTAIALTAGAVLVSLAQRRKARAVDVFNSRMLVDGLRRQHGPILRSGATLSAKLRNLQLGKGPRWKGSNP